MENKNENFEEIKIENEEQPKVEDKEPEKDKKKTEKKSGVDAILLLTILVIIALASFVVLPPVFRVAMPKPVPTPTPTPKPTPTPDISLATGTGEIVCTLNDEATGERISEIFRYNKGIISGYEFQKIQTATADKTVDQLLATCNIAFQELRNKSGIQLYCIASGGKSVSQTINVDYYLTLKEELNEITIIEFKGIEKIAEIITARELKGYTCEQ